MSVALGTFLIAAAAGFSTVIPASALTTNFCGYYVVANNIYCAAPNRHSYNWVAGSTPYEVQHLCVNEVTDAGNFKAPRNGTQNCATWSDYHTACYNPTPYSYGKVWWGKNNSLPGNRLLYGTAATGVSGCPT